MRIEVIDSATYTYIYGHIVVLAAELRDQGDSFDAILGVAVSYTHLTLPTTPYV